MASNKYVTPELQEKLGPNFWDKLVQVCSEVGLSPEDLLVVMVSESGLQPHSYSSGAQAAGLVQFTPIAFSGVGWTRGAKEFSKLPGEEQLDYVKILIQNLMKQFNSGQPFKSALQYYVANFWPVALKLPGIKQEDLSTPFLEKTPETVTESGKVYSKKYYDIGFKIPASMESKAYRDNPISTTGSITLGDMKNWIDRKRQNPIYLEALKELENAKNYVPNQPKDVEEKAISLQSNISEEGIENLKEIEDLSKILSLANYLPTNFFTIKISNNDINNSIEFARILSAILDERLISKSFVHTDNVDVDLQVKISGPKKESINAIKEVTSATIEAFKLATKKINSPLIKVSYSVGKSSLQEITLKSADLNYRKFLLKFI